MTYYFIDDFNDIVRQKDSMDKDFAEVIDLVDIIDDINKLAEENKDNKAMIEFLDTENTQIMNELKTRTQIQHQLEEENEQLKQFIQELTTKSTGQIDLADGYSYSVSAVLTNWRDDADD